MDSGLWTVRHRVAVVAIIQGGERGATGVGVGESSDGVGERESNYGRDRGEG